MRVFLIQTLLLFTAYSGFAQTELRFGFTANPLLSWMKPESAEIDKGKMRAGIEYGLISDINFSPNYILSSGITVSVGGGNLNYSAAYADSFLFRFPGDTLFNGETDVRLKLQYINLPLVFKMRTNEIGPLKYYGAFGVIPAFRFKARADAEVNDSLVFDNLNIVKRKNQTDDVFRSTVFNISLHVEAGIEFPFSDRTSLIAGVFYRNGFVNSLKDGDEDKIMLNNLGLRIGVIF